MKIHAPALIIALLLALATPVAASFEGVTAGGVSGQAGEGSGQATFLWAEGRGAGAIHVEIAAQHGDFRFTDSRQTVVTPLRLPLAPIVPAEIEHSSAGYQDVNLSAYGPETIVTVFAEDGATLTANMGHYLASSIQDPYFQSELGFQKDPTGTDTGYDTVGVRHFTLPGQHVYTETQADGLHVTIRGDLMVEIHHAMVEIEHTDGERTVDTRTRFEAVGPAPSESQEAIQKQVDTTLRVRLTDAVVTVKAPSMDGLAQWLQPSAEIDPAGTLTLLDATGTILEGGQRQELDGDHILRSAPDVILQPQDDRMAVNEPSSQSSSSATAVIASPSTWAWGIPALALLAGVLLWRRRATLPRVEALIDAGRYQRAAVMAAHLMRRHPTNENLIVARAVALSKSGQHGLVIQEGEARLQAKGSSDGVLPYLVGRAHLSTGAKTQAIKRFNEAVRLTPSLGGAVAELLPRRRQETGGYV